MTQDSSRSVHFSTSGGLGLVLYKPSGVETALTSRQQDTHNEYILLSYLHISATSCWEPLVLELYSLTLQTFGDEVGGNI